MRMCWLLLIAGLMTSSSVFAGLVQYSTTTPTPSGGTSAFGGTLYRYTFLVSGFNFQANQELDIRFDATQFSHISLVSGVQPGFSTLLLQPNNPTGSVGSFSAMATSAVNGGTFVLDAYFTGTGAPGSQLYLINQYQADGFTFVGTLQSGTTVAATPEPNTFAIGGAMLALGAVLRRSRRK